MYVESNYNDDTIPDFMFLDHIVKYFIWKKKSYRLKKLKRNRYHGNKDIENTNELEIWDIIKNILGILLAVFVIT